MKYKVGDKVLVNRTVDFKSFSHDMIRHQYKYYYEPLQILGIYNGRYYLCYHHSFTKSTLSSKEIHNVTKNCWYYRESDLLKKYNELPKYKLKRKSYFKYNKERSK